MQLIQGMNESAIGLMMNIAVISIFVLTAPFVSNGLINGIYLAVLTLGTMAAFEAVFPIPLAVQYLDSSIKAGERLFQITDQKIEPKNTEHIPLIGKEIEFEKVSFSYIENENILNEISFQIKEKQKIAIIGATGNGKSSIINLLLKFWEINSGSISFDKINYSKISEDEVREKYSVIPQKVFLFSDTIKNNLLLAKPNATEAEIWNALKMAELSNFVELLPNKLNTWIGNQGKQLSGGERKRLAIARAILKDAPIFICDEITANLDSINEQKIINTIHSITKEKSLIFITHRLVDMDKFDSIFLLQNGKISASGTHFELLANSESYRRYFSSK
jgi:ATP-binding cassette subfamily C protein CydC